MIKKHKLLLISFIVLGFLSIIGSVSAANNSSVYSNSTIQSAIDHANSGQTIYVYDNNSTGYTYHENIFINKTVHLVGSGSVTVNAYNSSRPTITLGSGAVNSTIRGLTISGATNSYGIDLEYVENCNITQNNINNNQIGIYLLKSKNIIISNNDIHHNTGAGVYAAGCSDIEGAGNNDPTRPDMGSPLDPTKIWKIVQINGNNIYNNHDGVVTTSANGTNSRWLWIVGDNIHHNTNTGVTIINSTNHFIQDSNITYNRIGILINGSYGMAMYCCTCGCDWGNSLERNTIKNNTEKGVYLNQTEGNFLIGNYISNNPDGVYVSGGQKNNINDNTITNNTTGITVVDSNSNDINENKQISQNGIGVFIKNSPQNTIQLNTISNNSGNGLYLDDTSYNTIRNNQITGNFDGILTNRSNNNEITLNTIINNKGNGVKLVGGEGNRIENNWAISKNSAYGIFIQNGTSTTIESNEININGLGGINLDNCISTDVNGNDLKGNPKQAVASNGSVNTFNGNYWSDWISPDTNKDGVVDKVRSISGNEGITDKSPLTTPFMAVAVTSNVKPGSYNTSKSVVLSTDAGGIIYYTTNGLTPTTSNKKYTGPITISSTTTLKYWAIDETGNVSPVYSQVFTIDKVKPTASVNVKGGVYKSTQKLYLRMSESGSIYYTLNGSTPTTKSKKFSGTFSVASSATLKYFAVDKAGNKSPVYTQKYTIDKKVPYVSSASPKNGVSNVKRSSTLTIKFSEVIKNSTNWSKIYVKDVKTGKKISISKSVKGSVLYIKTSKKAANTQYQIYIPAGSIRDAAGNKLAKTYTYKIRTGRT